jgi:hypothetical protein
MSDNDTDDVEDGLEALRKESTSGGGNRIDHDAAKRDSAVDELVDSLERVDDGDLSKTLSFWDPDMAAVLAVIMDDDERLVAIVDALADDLGADVEAADADRSDVLKLAVRAALQDADPDLFEDLREARRERAIAEADEHL